MSQPLAQQQQQYYILASAEALPETPLVLKHNDVFGVFDRYGDIDTSLQPANGVFFEGTRFLSRSRLRFAASRPLLLSSTVRRDNIVLATDLTNPDLYQEGHGLFLARGSLHIYRSQFLWQDALYQQIEVKNFSREAIEIRLDWEFGADFADIFEVRGTPRERRGQLEPPRRAGDAVIIEYHGLDGLDRRTVIRCPTDPEALHVDGLRWVDYLEPGAALSFEVSVAFERDSEVVETANYESGLAKATARLSDCSAECSIWTSNEQFNAWLHRSDADLRMLCTEMPDGIYPYAGIPWFATPFGRDGIWTALECLWMDPSIARGVLRYLTRTQARTISRQQDAEPGKIIHEAREGEMAALGEIPFGRYYGSVDATPLYLLLASAYYRRTGDRELLEEIWSGVERALAWIDGYGDADRDGFVEYYRKAEGGLIQQGWKDSVDSIFHQNGALAEGPIALSEVQAYVYGAKTGLASIAGILRSKADGDRLMAEASRLQAHFEEAFWLPSLGTYALALDGEKRPCEVRSSNAGHALFCGIARKDRAYAVASSFLTERFYSGWGIRTIAEGEARYNPMSYHNGSIWPHDNAVISAGMSRYGFTELSAKILSGLFQAAASLELSRLPELFCGFQRRIGKMPTWYPTACSPQAWSAASVFSLLKSCVGLSINALDRSLILRYPVLPEFLDTIYMRNLIVGDAVADLRLFRSGNSVAATVERRVGDLDIMVLR
ncbi:MAG: amylo-alpha,6-glucosidase [Bryobacterales bacterium]|nr:amylo-alpha,6-glucosidase [Bryobacterales bacterium]